MPATDLIDCTVLVVDDMKLMRDMAGAMLRARGVGQIESCSDGGAALAALDAISAANRLCDLILLDLKMPGMDGVETLRHLATRGYAGQIALFSGESPKLLRTAEALARTHRLNILGIVEKPITMAAIDALLARLRESRLAMPDDHITPFSEAELLDAIREGQIEIAVQPKVAIASRQVIGTEALARWRHPQRGLLGAGAFVPLAESGKAAEPLFNTVLTQALAALATWRQQGLKLQMAINISSVDLTRLDLPERIMQAAAEAGLKPDDVILEVTESRIIDNLAAALEVLTRLRLNGFGLAIDDFGTGYATLEQLQRFPFEEMKIDRQFVGQADSDPAARAIVSSSIGLARTLGMVAVAEGVECQADWDAAASLGCDVAQGYLISPPLSPDQLPDWLAQWN